MVFSKSVYGRAACWWLLLALGIDSAGAAEPFRTFLEALRNNGLHDSALQYLDQMAGSPLAPRELRESLLYEKGLTLIAASRTQLDLVVRDKQIQDAQQLLRDFLDQHEGHVLAGAARGQLGNLIVERARVQMEMSRKSETNERHLEARRLYEEAMRVFEQLQQDHTQALEKLPAFPDEKDPQQRGLTEKRDQLRNDVVDAQLMLAWIREEIADTYGAGSRQSMEKLSEAAAQFEAIHDRNRTRMKGLYARMYQGRCLQKQKKLKEALGLFDQLLDEGDTPIEMRALKAKTMQHAMECWLDPAEKKYVEAIRRCGDWLTTARPNEERTADWMGLRLQLARAHQLQAQELKSSKPNDRAVTQALNEARGHAALVARFANPFQREAQALLGELGGSEPAGDFVQATDFASAQDAGRESIQAMQAGSVLTQQLSERLSKESVSQEKAALQQQLNEATGTVERHQRQAMASFRLALRLADDQADRTELNMVRYYLGYLHYDRGDYYDAAAICEFVARRYSDHPTARPCAKIAMISYLKLYAENTSKDKQFETDRVISAAEYLATRWPEQPEAEEALGTLIPFMINSGQLERAQSFLEKIPESSPRRGEGELKTGQAIWAAYLRGMHELVRWESEGAPEGVDATARRRELDEFKPRAMQMLESGYERLKQNAAPDQTTFVALLSLAHIYVESQEPLKAIGVLEHKILGPLTRLDQADGKPAEPSLVEETYKTALRAYIGALAVSEDRDESLRKAQDIMARMTREINARGGQDRLLDVFISLARSLEDQLRIATPEHKVALSAAFETFLKQIREGTAELSVLNWIAETFLSMGAGLDAGPRRSADAPRFYKESQVTFEKIVSLSKASPDQTLRVNLRLALLARRQRDFSRALDAYVQVLTANPLQIQVQAEAAKTLQEWAIDSGTASLFDQAIVGHRPGKDGRNVVWGWGRIAQSTARNTQFKDIFHEANVNMAVCRELRSATLQGDARTRLLNSAFNGVALVRRLYPDLGGEQWQRQYDAIVKRIQKAQGAPQIGLAAIPAPTPGP